MKSTTRKLGASAFVVSALLVLSGCTEGPTLNELAKKAGYDGAKTVYSSDSNRSIVEDHLDLKPNCKPIKVQIEREKDESPNKFDVIISLEGEDISYKEDLTYVYQAEKTADWARDKLNLESICD